MLAYNVFDGIVFAGPTPGATARPRITSNSFIDTISASPGGRFLSVVTEPRDVAPGTNTCHGGIAY